MSRIISFRVWDKEEKCYSDKAFSIDQLGICYVQDEDGYWEEIDEERYVVEQDTGLTDKNGKVINEGDIVEALIDGMWSTGRNTVSFGKAKWRLEVLYNDIRFMDVFRVIGSKNCPDRIYYLFDKELSELKAIGNIHENADLLGGGK